MVPFVHNDISERIHKKQKICAPELPLSNPIQISRPNKVSTMADLPDRVVVCESRCGEVEVSVSGVCILCTRLIPCFLN